jgi:hypothetical protein
MVVLSTLRRRLSSWILLMVSLILFLPYSVAHAAGDPLGTAQTSVDGGIGLVTTYGPVLGSMYLLYQLASRLVAKYARTSWFAKGKRLAITTGVLGVAGAALQAQVAGSPWNVIALAAIAAVFKLLTPTVPSSNNSSNPSTPSDPASPVDPTVPPASLPTVPLAGPLARAEKVVALGALFLVLGIVISDSGCGPTSTAVLNAALDCTTPARNDLVDALTPTAVTAIRKIADPSGKITTDALKALFSGASLNSEAGVIVACAEARAVEFLAALLPIPLAATSAQGVDKDHVDGPVLRAALASQFPGVVFKTSR